MAKSKKKKKTSSKKKLKAKKKTKKKTSSKKKLAAKKKAKKKTSTKSKKKKTTSSKKKLKAKKKSSAKKATKKKTSTAAKKKSPKKQAPKKQEAKKVERVEEEKKAPIPLNNPYKLFQEVWDPKNESFLAGITRLFSEYSVPGKTEKQQAENTGSIVEKIESSMRKEPIPDGIIEQWNERFPQERSHQIASIVSMKPRTTIRLNTLKVDLNGFAQSKVAKSLKAKRCSISPWAFDCGQGENPTKHPVYERGLFELEDEASQFVTLLLNARPGQRVLDMCARDGDHTLGAAAMMKNKGSLFVYDADINRLRDLKHRSERAGVENIRILSDSQVSEVKSLDAVLVDAPSTGNGHLARQPEIKWRFRKEDQNKIQKVQAALLREAARKLKLGGRLIYATSSLNISENEAQVEHFLKASHNSYRLVPALDYFKEYVQEYLENFYGFEMSDELVESFVEYDPYFLLSPDVHGCNGVFAAVIERVRISN